MHAWYSKKQYNVIKEWEELNKNEKKFCEFVYLNKNNNEVICTEVTKEKKSYWDDAHYLGQVYKWVRSIEYRNNIQYPN